MRGASLWQLVRKRPASATCGASGPGMATIKVSKLNCETHVRRARSHQNLRYVPLELAARVPGVCGAGPRLHLPA